LTLRDFRRVGGLGEGRRHPFGFADPATFAAPTVRRAVLAILEPSRRLACRNARLGGGRQIGGELCVQPRVLRIAPPANRASRRDGLRGQDGLDSHRWRSETRNWHGWLAALAKRATAYRAGFKQPTTTKEALSLDAKRRPGACPQAANRPLRSPAPVGQPSTA
jgi:hypothetical protein